MRMTRPDWKIRKKLALPRKKKRWKIVLRNVRRLKADLQTLGEVSMSTDK